MFEMMAKYLTGSSFFRLTLCWIVVFLAVFSTVYCQKTNLKYTVKEGVGNGTPVGNVAIDGQLYKLYTQEQLESITYTLTSADSKVTQVFRIDQITGLITTFGRLDREDLCTLLVDCILKFNVNVYIKDSKSGTFDLQVIQVQIILEDVNDNFPTFPKSHIFLDISESVTVGDVSFIKAATDKDTGKNNSIQSYLLLPDDGMFRVNVEDSVTGFIGIEVLKKLDRETQDLYGLKVIAIDGGTPAKTGTLSISLKVTDANDHKPTFLNTVFNISILEDYPVKFPITKFSAVDKDIGSNGQFSFHFSSRTSVKVKSILAINASTGVLYSIKQLDYEEDPEFQFLVEVNDMGNPSLSSEASVIVNILDVNDNAPEIIVTVSDAMRELPESIELGTFIGYVSVSDKDSGQNGEVTCDISDDHFKLLKFSDFNYYKIKVDKTLDFETQVLHNVKVTCGDKGNPSKSTYSLFNISILDTNDNRPMFPSEIIASNITENNKIGEVILRLSATDKDGPGNNDITYSIFEDLSNMVKVSLLGEVTANKSYDREKTSTFQFIVEAKDSGSPSQVSTATVIVTVGDENDTPPYFTQAYFLMNAVENTPSDIVIGKITAIDPDETNEYYFSFLVENNVTEYFSIESDSGRIATNKEINMKAGNRLDFGVVVVDLVNPAFIDFANVTVNITDDLDLAPVISYPQNDSVTVAYDTVVGSIIATVQAYDTISGDKITYSLNYGNDKELFFINYINGEIIIAKEISLANVGTYEIIIGVHDVGTPVHSSYAKMYIVVTGPTVGANTLNDNIIIVIVVVCVTLILSLAIGVSICLIRKIDRNRKNRRQAQKPIKTIYTIENEEYNADDKDSGIESEKFRELELNVDVEDPVPFENRSSISPSSYMSHDKSFTSNTFTSNGFTSRKLVHFNDHEIFCKMVDAVSDTSGGTDSGRGCSDEDINSVRGSLQILKHSDSIYSVASYV